MLSQATRNLGPSAGGPGASLLLPHTQGGTPVKRLAPLQLCTAANPHPSPGQSLTPLLTDHEEEGKYPSPPYADR